MPCMLGGPKQTGRNYYKKYLYMHAALLFKYLVAKLLL